MNSSYGLSHLPWLALIASCLAFWVGTGCSSGGGGEENPLPFEPAGPSAAPDPMAPGPFPVGVKTFELTDESRTDPDTGELRFLLTEVWYPAVQGVREGPFWTYDAKLEVTREILGDKYDPFMAADLPLIDTLTTRDAELDREHGPYPVILFSHGANGVRWQSIFYTAHLASHGYVVISPDHQYNTIWDLIRDGYDSGTVVTSSYKRLDDMSFLLDEFLTRNETRDDFFYHSMNPRKVAGTGHSFGGFTSIAMPCKDPRFGLAVTHSPLISLTVGWCDLQDYPVPVMVQGGTLDVTLPWKDQYCDYQSLDGDHDRYLVEMVDAGHYTFADICQLDLLSLTEELDFGGAVEDALEDGCAAYNLPWAEAHPAINHYATAMFNLHLRDSVDSAGFLVEKSGSPFDVVNFFEGLAPDFPDGGCGN